MRIDVRVCDNCGTIAAPDEPKCPTCVAEVAALVAELNAAPVIRIATAPKRVVRCRYIRRTGTQCTGEAVDELGELLVCARHLAMALELLKAGAA